MNTPIEKQIKFYGSWNNESSELLINMDKELQQICFGITRIDLTEVIPLTIHYESSTIEEMTHKLSSIKALSNIDSPLISIDGYFYLDKESRYFKEDFMYGLCNIKGYAKILNLKTPNIDKVLMWYEKIFNEKLFFNGEFIGASIKNTGVPQNFGLNSLEDIYSFYKNGASGFMVGSHRIC